jgi:hypothetical protein
MAIEFGCTSCRQLVRVGDNAAGKKGKCPHCGTILQIPGPAPSPGPAPAASPTISFPCPGCGKTMKAPAALAGKRGKCPHCQTMFVVGGGPVAAPVYPRMQPLGAGDLTPLDEGFGPVDGIPGLAPLGGPGAADLFAGLQPLPPQGQPLAGSPFANPLGAPAHGFGDLPPQPVMNPYAPLGGRYGAAMGGGYAKPAGMAPVKLLIPAIGMAFIAVLSLGWIALSTMNSLLQPMPDFDAQFGNRPDAEAVQMGAKFGYYTAIILFPLVGGVLNIVVLAGAVQMMRLKGWEMAKAGAMAAIFPCCSLLCLNMPLGIWALIVLNQPDVRRQFL